CGTDGSRAMASPRRVMSQSPPPERSPMGPVWYRFRAELRRRWRAWVGLGLLLGFAVGVVAAVVAAGRRAETSADRFHTAYAGFDAYVSNYPDPFTAVYPPAEIERLPMVASSARVRLDFLGPAIRSWTPRPTAHSAGSSSGPKSSRDAFRIPSAPTRSPSAPTWRLTSAFTSVPVWSSCRPMRSKAFRPR